MKVLGIIAEYNPFHYGHLYHLKKSREQIRPDFVLAVMSGNFTQRGEAAIADKWIRAEAAVRCGIDLVLELPAVYAVQTAELFAYGGIQVLNHTGLTTHVSFGSETGSLELLEDIADLLVSEDPAYRDSLKAYLRQGLSFPAARYRAVLDYEAARRGRSDPELRRALTGSNSILAIEYLKALKQTESMILPVTVPRIHSSYRSRRIKKGIASATSIRREILCNGMSGKVRDAVPESVFRVLSGAFAEGMGPVDNHALENLILGLIRRSDAEEIRAWLDVGEGLENRIKESAQHASDLDGLLSGIKTKRYVQTRLQRIMIHGLLNLTTETFRRLNTGMGPKYLRILAFSENAAPLLKRLKETARVPILTKPAHIARQDPPVQEMFAFDRLAGDLYGLGMKNPDGRRGDRDYRQGVFRL